MNKIMPNWWSFIFGITMALFTIQPYSIRYSAIPLQIVLSWFLLIWVMFFKPKILLNSLRRFDIIQKLVIFSITLIIFIKIINGDIKHIVFFQLCTGIVLAILASIICDQEKSRKIVFNFIFITSALSGFVALLQFLGLANWTWAYTIYYGTGVTMPSGLEFYPVALSYSLICPCVVLIVAYFFQKANRIQLKFIPRYISLPCITLILLSFILSQSRSGVLAIFVGILFSIVMCIKLKRKFLPISLVFSIIIIFITIGFLGDDVFKGIVDKTEKVTTDMRTGSTWSIFAPLIIEYPFGAPISEMKGDNSKKYGIGRSSKQKYKDAMKQTGGYDPHNFIITAALYFGIPVAFLLIVFYWGLFYRGIKEVILLKKNINAVGVYILILLAANLAIIVHGWFHNASIVFGEMRLWFWVGLLVGYTKIAYLERIKLIKIRQLKN